MESYGGWLDADSPTPESQPTTTISNISVWMDRLSKQEGKIQDSHDFFTLDGQGKEKEEVPLYDRACLSALSSQDSDLSDRYSSGYSYDEPEEASRCFNCGSSSHSLNDCHRPRDTAAINSSCRVLQEKRGSFARLRPVSRYYMSTTGGKFDDLKPGVLGLDTRKALGIEVARMESSGGWLDADSPTPESQPTTTTTTKTTISNISVWMDRLSKQEGKIQDSDDFFTLDGQGKEKKEVPLYDRACLSALSSQDSDLSDRYSSGYSCDEPEEASRCFNCGSYSHSLNDCHRPRDTAAINSSRRVLQEKRGSFARLRPASRYYMSTTGGKFDDLKPGVLGLDTRKALGIGELDPPPWLNWMRDLGYPPGYLEEEDEESSGVEIFGVDMDDSVSKEITKDGNAAKETSWRPAIEKVTTRKRMMVEFPGINSAIPLNANEKLWAPPSIAIPEQLQIDEDELPPGV